MLYSKKGKKNVESYLIQQHGIINTHAYTSKICHADTEQESRTNIEKRGFNDGKQRAVQIPTTKPFLEHVAHRWIVVNEKNNHY